MFFDQCVTLLLYSLQSCIGSELQVASKERSCLTLLDLLSE